MNALIKKPHNLVRVLRRNNKKRIKVLRRLLRLHDKQALLYFIRYKTKNHIKIQSFGFL